MDPLPVDVQLDWKDIGDFVISIINAVATIAIPLVLWHYGRRQEAAKDRHERELRLQAHVDRLADTDAMHVISEFKSKCEAKKRDYGAVFAARQPVEGVATAQELRQVDTARRRLQGLWDNVKDDYKAGRLPGDIWGGTSPKMLHRGLFYMRLVEPLEAANFARMELSGEVDAGTSYLVQEAPAAPAAQAAAAAPATQAAPAAPAAGGGGGDPTWRFAPGPRPGRFSWLEDQLAAHTLAVAAADAQPVGAASWLAAWSCCSWWRRPKPAVVPTLWEKGPNDTTALVESTWARLRELSKKDAFEKHWAQVKKQYNAVWPEPRVSGNYSPPAPEACAAAAAPGAPSGGGATAAPGAVLGRGNAGTAAAEVPADAAAAADVRMQRVSSLSNV